VGTGPLADQRPCCALPGTRCAVGGGHAGGGGGDGSEARGGAWRRQTGALASAPPHGEKGWGGQVKRKIKNKKWWVPRLEGEMEGL
jgi:hypothetical protein